MIISSVDLVSHVDTSTCNLTFNDAFACILMSLLSTTSAEGTGESSHVSTSLMLMSRDCWMPTTLVYNDQIRVNLYAFLGDIHGNYLFVEYSVKAVGPPGFLFLHLLGANGHRRILYLVPEAPQQYSPDKNGGLTRPMD